MQTYQYITCIQKSTQIVNKFLNPHQANTPMAIAPDKETEHFLNFQTSTSALNLLAKEVPGF